MDIGLCMIVKDEETRIRDCLDPIKHCLSDIVIVDTGSSDRTRQVLEEEFEIAVLRSPEEIGGSSPSTLSTRPVTMRHNSVPWSGSTYRSCR